MDLGIREGRLEPEVIGHNMPMKAASVLSAAISLKRIADILERKELREHGEEIEPPPELTSYMQIKNLMLVRRR